MRMFFNNMLLVLPENMFLINGFSYRVKYTVVVFSDIY